MFEEFSLLNVEPMSWQGVATAVLCGLIVGAERQLRGKPVGVRTGHSDYSGDLCIYCLCTIHYRLI